MRPRETRADKEESLRHCEASAVVPNICEEEDTLAYEEKDNLLHEEEDTCKELGPSCPSSARRRIRWHTRRRINCHIRRMIHAKSSARRAQHL